jgi:hypothetical protein
MVRFNATQMLCWRAGSRPPSSLVNSAAPGWLYTLTPDGGSITPDITDPNTYALLCYHTVKLFVDPEHEKYAFRTRAFSESFGSRSRFLSTLEMEIHKLENGEMFSGWQNYFSWLSGMAGLPLAEILTDMHVNAPLWNATLTREGCGPFRTRRESSREKAKRRKKKNYR